MKKIILIVFISLITLLNASAESSFTDFETFNGWTAAGSGQGKFEIGVPVSFSASGGECQTTCLGTGPSGDHSAIGQNAACTNLDGHMAPNDGLGTNSLSSPVFDFSESTNINLVLWRFMEIEGDGYDFCYYQYKNSPTGQWVNFETYGTTIIDDNSWVRYTRDISSIAAGKSYFALRFYCTTDSYTEGSGLCLDDINISWNGAGVSICGNGIIENGEECDDGNLVSNDGCSSACMIDIPNDIIKICDWKDCHSGAASVSIDDSYTSCRDVLNAHGWKGTYYLMDTTHFSQSTWNLWTTIYNEGHELGCHTQTHPCKSVSDSQLRYELSSNINDILTHIPGISDKDVTSFAWPCGFNTQHEKDIASEYFISSRGYHINKLEDKNPADFMELKCINTPHYHEPSLEPPSLFLMADEAESQGKWASFVFHNECEDDGAIDYLATKDLWVEALGRVAKYILERQNSEIIIVQNTTSFTRFNLSTNLNLSMYDQELTLKVFVGNKDVEALKVNNAAKTFSTGAGYIQFNILPTGNDEIEVLYEGENCTDNDNDGYYAISTECSTGDDCNDNNDKINPGAAEICNGVDDNCNGEIDEVCIYFNVSLKQGWNLISIPLDLENNSVNNIFGNRPLYAYNNSWFVPEDINNNSSYWVKSDENVNITVIGTQLSNNIIELNNGLNLVGYPSLEEKNISIIFNNINNSLINVLGYENNNWISYSPFKSSNTLETMKPGYGYWVNVNCTEVNWTIT